jgi:DNA-binding response OmpR family regulator
MAHILLVDDDASTRSECAKFLTGRGHVVYEVADGTEGRDLIGVMGIELAIVELMNSREEGLRTLLQYRQAFPDLGMIATCVHSSNAPLYLHMAVRVGASRGLTKPVPPAILGIAANAVLRDLQQARERGGPAIRETTA